MSSYVEVLLLLHLLRPPLVLLWISWTQQPSSAELG